MILPNHASRAASFCHAAVPFALSLSLSLMACAGRPSSPPPRPVPAAGLELDGRPLEVVPPFAFTTAEDAVVRVIGDSTCTGALVADDLVLTAHHCVSARDDAGRPLDRDVHPRELSIELGGDDLPWGEVGVRAIVSPECGHVSGEGDIALLVLERRLIGIATLTPRLDGAPAHGEAIEPVGFGRCRASRSGIRRNRRAGGAIEAIGPGQFVAQAAICPGDSGGPAVGLRGDLVGVVSASVMDGDDQTRDVSYFTRLDAWRGLFAAARSIGDGASASELPPFRSCSK